MRTYSLADEGDVDLREVLGVGEAELLLAVVVNGAQLDPKPTKTD
jgi:hypothetical protein